MYDKHSTALSSVLLTRPLNRLETKCDTLLIKQQHLHIFTH